MVPKGLVGCKFVYPLYCFCHDPELPADQLRADHDSGYDLENYVYSPIEARPGIELDASPQRQGACSGLGGIF